MDSRNLAIAGMLGLLAVSLLIQAPLTAQPTLTPGLEDLSGTFRGLTAYLDNDISTYTVNGVSMAPTFGEGDVVIRVDFPYENLRVGDIIVFSPVSPSVEFVSHRIIGISSQGISTKGDGNGLADRGALKEENVYGLVIGILFTSSKGWHS